MRILKMAVVAAGIMFASAGSAATLIHSYDFDGNANDSVGTANGTLLNGASVSGGALVLDGTNDYVQFGSKLVNTAADFSVFIRYATTGQNKSITEIISQGFSGQPGFYIGTSGNTLRLTDNYSGGTIAFPSNGQYHNLLVTSSVSGGTRVYLDSAAIAFSGVPLTASMSGGDNTRFGTQFSTYDEYFKGSLDAVRIYSGIATYAEATSPVPEPASWALLVGGFGLVGGALRARSRMPAIA